MTLVNRRVTYITQVGDDRTHAAQAGRNGPIMDHRALAPPTVA
jgi:hypothetical protein